MSILLLFVVHKCHMALMKLQKLLHLGFCITIMDARLTAEQKHIQQTTREFLEDNGGIELARRKMNGDDDEDVVDEIWEGLRELDFPSVNIPQQYGGLGQGMLYLACVLEELGRYATPCPFPETSAFGVPILANLGTEQQKEQYFNAIAEQGVKISFAIYDDENESVPAAISLQPTSTENGYRLSGTKKLVPYADEVDILIVPTRTKEGSGYNGITLFLVDTENVKSTKKASFDRTRPLYEVEFNNIKLEDSHILGTKHQAGNALSDAIDRYNVGISAWLAGGAGRAVDMSVKHLNEREQYGQPIGRYQAPKHRTVEMWTDKEHMVTLAYYAAWAIENDTPEAPRAAAMAKAYTATCGPHIFQRDIWNQGGKGFTWDHDGHIYFKQSKSWQNFLGSPDEQLDRIADIREYSNRGLPDYPDITSEAYK